MDACLAVFPDTNVFMHGKQFQELPWSEFGDFAEYRIVVSPTVLSELDKHAHDAKRAKRARAAIALLDKAADANDGLFVIKDSGPKLVITVGPYPPVDAKPPHPLDLSNPDHKILFEFICAAKAIGVPAVYMTFDRAAFILAKSLNLSAKRAPDGWQLGVESGEHEKQLKAMEEKIKALQATQPVVQLGLLDKSGKPIVDVNGASVVLSEGNPKAPISITLQEYPELTPSQIEELLALAKSKYPLKTSFPKDQPERSSVHSIYTALHATGQWEPPSEVAIATYTEELYPAWVEKVEQWLMDLDPTLNSVTNSYLLTVVLANTGGIPAKKLLIEFELLTEGLQFGWADDVKEIKGPPPPPFAPRGRFVTLAERLAGMSNFANLNDLLHPSTRFDLGSLLGTPPPHDPYRFYRHPRSKLVSPQKRGLICDVFRHKGKDETFTLYIRPTPDKELPSKGAIQIQASAENLPSPVKVIVSLKPTYETLDTRQKAIELLAKPDYPPAALDFVEDEDDDS